VAENGQGEGGKRMGEPARTKRDGIEEEEGMGEGRQVEEGWREGEAGNWEEGAKKGCGDKGEERARALEGRDTRRQTHTKVAR